MTAPEQDTAPALSWSSWEACLKWLADGFATAVHDRQDPAVIERWWRWATTLTAPDGRDPGLSFAVLLAACMSPDRSIESASRWLDELGWRLDEDAERYDREARAS